MTLKKRILYALLFVALVYASLACGEFALYLFMIGNTNAWGWVLNSVALYLVAAGIFVLSSKQ